MSGQRGGTMRHLLRSPRGAFALAVLALLAVTALVSLFWLPANPDQSNISEAWQSPSLTHWLGTDILGRDVFSRLLYGSRVSLFAGFSVVLLGASFGTAIGILAAWLRGWGEEALMRFTDLVLCFPPIILALALAAALGIGTSNTIIAMLVVRPCASHR